MQEPWQFCPPSQPFWFAAEGFGKATLVFVPHFALAKNRTERFPKVCLFIMRDSDVRTVLSVWVSFSVSRIVSLHVLFRWLVKWDIAGSPFTLACYCLSTCSLWPPPLTVVQSLGVRRYRIIWVHGYGAYVGFGSRCLIPVFQSICKSLAIFEYIPFWSQV